MFEGEHITPKLKLVRLLGQEGKSHVWEAEHVGLGHPVAVKLMGRTLSRNSSPLHRFQREAEVAVKQLKSPQFAQILEHGLTRSGMPYLAMELLAGEDLETRILRDGPMVPRDVLRLVSQLGKGLTKAHLLGLVHRNLKPGNIFLVEGENEGEFVAKVLDLGLSVRAGISSMGRTTSDATHMLNPEFLSPEQIFGLKDVDFRADLWALAVLAYYTLTGSVPFSEKNLDNFATAIEDGRFEPATKLVAGLPSTVDSWFAKALQRDPAARFATAKEMAEELERALGLSEISERTSRTSLTASNGRSSSGTSTGSNRRPVLSSSKEISERLPLSVREAAMRSAPQSVTVTVAPKSSRSSAALIIALLAIVGLGTVGAGLALLSGGRAPSDPGSHGENAKPHAQTTH